jgi:hypothetical protein
VPADKGKAKAKAKGKGKAKAKPLECFAIDESDTDEQPLTLQPAPGEADTRPTSRAQRYVFNKNFQDGSLTAPANCVFWPQQPPCAPQREVHLGSWGQPHSAHLRNPTLQDLPEPVKEEYRRIETSREGGKRLRLNAIVNAAVPRDASYRSQARAVFGCY